MAAGRPKIFNTVEEMEEAIEKYFKSCWDNVVVIGQFGPVMVKDPENPEGEKIPLKEHRQIKPYTITGLALALGMTRETLLRYQENEDFSDTIKLAKAKVEEFAESHLFTAKNATGAIFSLKNNYGWKDKQEHEHTGQNGGPMMFKWEGE